MTTALANREVVVYALYLLGGATKRVHTEEVALKCFELAPDSFSWTRYPQYPDKDIVRVALTDARKGKHGGLVDGRAGQSRGQFQKTQRRPTGDGWTLTDAGVKWIGQNVDRLRSRGCDSTPKEHRQKLLQFLGRVRQHKAFKQYERAPERFGPSIGDLADLLRCRVDADQAVWRERFERIRKHAVAAGQNDVLDFIEKSTRAYEAQR